MTDLNELLSEARTRVDFEDHPDEWLDLISRMADAIDELKREMHARELHHFEEEQKSAELQHQLEAAERTIATARGLARPGQSVPLGVSEWRHYDRLMAETHRALCDYTEGRAS